MGKIKMWSLAATLNYVARIPKRENPLKIGLLLATDRNEISPNYPTEKKYKKKIHFGFN